jgi:hypothetical protein
VNIWPRHKKSAQSVHATLTPSSVDQDAGERSQNAWIKWAFVYSFLRAWPRRLLQDRAAPTCASARGIASKSLRSPSCITKWTPGMTDAITYQIHDGTTRPSAVRVKGSRSMQNRWNKPEEG